MGVHMNKEFGLSGSTLKIIAMISMLIDHIGAGFVWRLYIAGGFDALSGNGPFLQWLRENVDIAELYDMMRSIGRIAFPIYCFLLVEGFLHTRNKGKYALRLGIFAIISEVPFDLNFTGNLCDFGYQNVFFTLMIGVFTMLAYEWVEQKVEWKLLLNKLVRIGVVLAGMIIAYALRTDYDARGVVCIMVIYLCKSSKIMQLLAGALSFYWELPAPLAFVPIAFYNGKRGVNLKYVFYIFYPLHLLLIYGACCMMHLTNFPM